MQFIIDADDGHSISGWLAPDNPSSVPHFIVVTPGRDEIVVRANVQRDGIRDMGLHATGECGFCITSAQAPGLDKLLDVEILEAETRLPIYRRFQPDVDTPKKIFLFDCSVIPQRRMLSEIKSRFSLSYFNSERNGLETTIAMIVNPINKSIFISGRSIHIRYGDLLREKAFMRVALLRDPHEELAERLYFLNFLVKEGSAATYADYTNGVTSLLDFAAGLNFSDTKALTSAFRSTNDAQRRQLMSPMTRVFGCDLDEAPKHPNVSRALDVLADFDVVGTRENFGLFRDLLAGVAGVDIFGGEEPLVFPTVKTLAATLAKIGIVNDLLADDLALYKYVNEAIAEGLTNPEALAARQS
jgi:hypothetical protein